MYLHFGRIYERRQSWRRREPSFCTVKGPGIGHPRPPICTPSCPRCHALQILRIVAQRVSCVVRSRLHCIEGMHLVFIPNPMCFSFTPSTSVLAFRQLGRSRSVRFVELGALWVVGRDQMSRSRNATTIVSFHVCAVSRFVYSLAFFLTSKALRWLLLRFLWFFVNFLNLCRTCNHTNFQTSKPTCGVISNICAIHCTALLVDCMPVFCQLGF